VLRVSALSWQSFRAQPPAYLSFKHVHDEKWLGALLPWRDNIVVRTCLLSVCHADTSTRRRNVAAVTFIRNLIGIVLRSAMTSRQRVTHLTWEKWCRGCGNVSYLLYVALDSRWISVHRWTLRSQWPRGLRHEMSSPARNLLSWVGIPLKAWMSICVYSVFVLSCVGNGLATGWSPIQGVLPTAYRIKNLKKRPGSNNGLYSHWGMKLINSLLGLFFTDDFSPVSVPS
jgi:hypothetical protein